MDRLSYVLTQDNPIHGVIIMHSETRRYWFPAYPLHLMCNITSPWDPPHSKCTSLRHIGCLFDRTNDANMTRPRKDTCWPIYLDNGMEEGFARLIDWNGNSLKVQL